MMERRRRMWVNLIQKLYHLQGLVTTKLLHCISVK